MKVTCIQNSINDELAERVGLGVNRPDYCGSITEGKEYIVLGLSYDPSLVTYFAGKPVIEIKDDNDALTAVPIFLFKVTDSTPSKYWKIHYSDNGSLSLYPDSFYQEFYHDDLSEGVQEVINDFKTICANFEEEESLGHRDL